MASMTYGCRITKKEGKFLEFKTYLIYSDWDSLPKTHGYGLQVLMHIATENGNESCPLFLEYGEDNHGYLDNNFEVL